MKIKVVLLILCNILISSIFYSCFSNDFSNISSEFTVGNGYASIYDNTLYYINPNTFTLCYQRLDNIKDTGTLVFNDPLAQQEDNPFTNIYGLYFMLVDANATSMNENYPILIIALNDLTWDEKSNTYIDNGYKIISFNTKNNSTAIIKNKIPNPVQGIFLYDKYIFYTTNDGDEGYNIYRINKDGKNMIKLDNSQNDLYYIQSIYEDIVYYVSMSGELYSSPLDLSSQTFLFNAVVKANVFVNDGYIYYCDNLQTTKINDVKFHGVDLCRVPLTDVSLKETVLSNISVCMNYENKIYYYPFNPKVFSAQYINEGTDSFFTFDINTGNITTIYENANQQANKYYIALSKRYIVFQINDFSDILSGNSTVAPSYMSCFDNATGEEKIIPY